MSDETVWRTFIALPLPPAWRDALADVMGDLRRRAPGGVRWVDPAGIHLTLRFLGATPPGRAPQVIDGLQTTLAGAEPPTLALDGLGTFPRRGPTRVLWVGVSGQTDRLERLSVLANATATELGWPAETRPFRPHLTIGRVRDRSAPAERHGLREALAAVAVPPAPAWTFGHVRLYRSILTPQGAVYSNLGEVKL